MPNNSSNKALVLIHGFCEDSTLWNHIIPHLTFEGKILSINLPGFGGTQLNSNNISLNDIAQQIQADLINNNITSCICIGHSLGGYVSLALKKSFPEFVTKIGLIHSSAYDDTPEKKGDRDKLIDFLDQNPAPRFLATFAHTLFYEANKEKLKKDIDNVVHMSDGLPGSTIQAYTKAMRDRENNIEILLSEDAPLFVAGKYDTSVPAEISKKQIGLIKDSRNCYMLDNVAHMGMYESPNAIINAINTYLSE